MEKIRILHVVSLMHQGGIENFLMNIYENIDRDKIQFDFLVHHKKRSAFDDKIEILGGRIYRFSFLDDFNLFKYIHELDEFFKEHKEYKIVHGHLASIGFIYLKYARKNGVPIRIAHSHGDFHINNLKGYAKNFMFKFFQNNANVFLACSDESGKYLFKTKEVQIIPNAIDFERFKFNKEKRIEIRKNLNIEKEFVIAHVGRFNLQKNHEFLIKVIENLKHENIKLLLFGEGELENKIKNLVKEKGLENKVVFMGIKENMYDYYQAMDLFVLPSFFEGLPVTGVEAQACGVDCIFSDKITKQTDISNMCSFLKLDYNLWAGEIDKFIDEYVFISSRRINQEKLNSDFNIKILSNNLENMYLNLFNKEAKNENI